MMKRHSRAQRRAASADLEPSALLARVRASGGSATLRQLAEGLGLDRAGRQELKRAIRDLVRQGVLSRLPRARYALQEEKGRVTGRVRRSLARVAFVSTERMDETDVLVPVRHLLDAMDGDRVQVRVTRVDAEGRREGRVERILERRHQRLWGVFRSAGRGGRVEPFVERFPGEVEIRPGSTGAASDGMAVGVELLRFPSESEGGAVGRIVEVLGDPDEPGVDLKLILRKHGLTPEFPPEAEEEAKRAARAALEPDLAGRVDYRRQTLVTIDGETAMDFDDAVSLEDVAGGGTRLFVHIADVSHFVAEGGALDAEARRRGTSVYFPGYAVPMLPHLLSSDWCSLKPGVDRLTFTSVIELDGEGQPRSAEFHPSIIRSAARMTYTEVGKILVERDPTLRERHALLVPLFERMERLCQLLLARRRERGSLDFDLPEVEIVLDEQGRTRQILPSERTVAHRIIEEFMLAANEAVARKLHGTKLPALYRIHEKPSPKRIGDLEELLQEFGYSLGADAAAIQPRDLQRALDLLSGRPEERFLSTAILRSLRLARYSDQNAGHFGLASAVYTHFTSPIRRYPDLVVHRLLRRSLAGKRAEPEERQQWRRQMAAIAEESSRLERQAGEAERELVEWKTLAYMNERVGEQYEGWVAGVMPFGLFVRLDDLFVEGLVHASTLEDERLRFEPRGHYLRSEGRGAVLKLGDRVKVGVDRVNVVAGQIDFSLVEHRGRPWLPLTGRRGRSRLR